MYHLIIKAKGIHAMVYGKPFARITEEIRDTARNLLTELDLDHVIIAEEVEIIRKEDVKRGNDDG